MSMVETPYQFSLPIIPAKTLSWLRNLFLLILLAGYSILNYGFLQIRFLGVIPIGQFVLLVSLLLINHRQVFSTFIKTRMFIPVIVWWILGFSEVLISLPINGAWALRDASHIADSLFLYVGFAFCNSFSSFDRLTRWLKNIFIALVLYSFTYPFREFLQGFSPALTGAQEQSTYLLFNYVNTALLLLAAAGYYLNEYFLKQKKPMLLFSLFILTLTLILFPSRTLFFELFAFIAVAFSFIIPKSKRLQASGILFLPVLLMSIVLLLNLPIAGRFGVGFSLQSYVQLFLEIFGLGNPEASVSSGNDIRFLWWQQILNQWSYSAKTMLFGLGFGNALTDFIGPNGIIIREPHNDFIGILARGGILALISFLWLQFYLIKNSLTLASLFKHRFIYSSTIIAIILITFMTLVNTIGESPFIMSFYAIPYYFLSGILLRLYQNRITVDSKK